MTAADDFARDARRAIAGQLTQPVLMVIGFAVMLTLAYCAGSSRGKASVKIAAAKSEVRRTETIRHIVAETVTVYVKVAEKAKATSDSLDRQVGIVNDTMLAVRMTPTDTVILVAIPAIVIRDIQALRQTVSDQQAAIGRLQVHVAADSAVIIAQARVIELQRPSKLGFKTGVVLGATAAFLVVRAVR
ncbi:MAG: hypothetical protein Q7R41_16345 [Phycisphaerales bacterium]|nr:hypothetical protein [Phycisphaerales bacterium]